VPEPNQGPENELLRGKRYRGNLGFVKIAEPLLKCHPVNFRKKNHDIMPEFVSVILPV
jgi:hypothetical protein